MRMEPTSSEPSFGRRLWRAFRNLLIFSLVVGLAGATVYMLSALNSRTWRLQVDHGRLVVMKGRMLPTGAEPWQPADPILADTYAPLELEGNTALAVTDAKYADRDELDRALFTVIELIAKPRTQSEAPADLEKGLALIRRAEKLQGLSDEQKLSLKRMQSDVSFYLARMKLDDARKELELALAQLKVAGDADNKHAREASQMLLSVEPQVKQLSDVLRAAVHNLSTPPPPPSPVVKEEPKADAGAAPEPTPDAPKP